MERDPEGQPRGLFVGLSTLDIIQRVPGVPGPDEKVTASRTDIAAGGPALNAAVVFSALGGHAALVTRVGQGGVSSLIREDIESRGVEIIDLADASFRPAVSTITVDDSTGQRQVVSTDARGGATEKATASPDDHTGLAGHLGDMGRIDIVHLDGHHPDITVTAARWGAARGLPRVVDAGRWKPVMATLIPQATDVVCSAAFRVPGQDDLMAWLLSQGPELAAVTHGPGPVEWRTGTADGAVAAEDIHAVDTLGAGDFFHGAYAFARTIRDPEGHRLRAADCLRFAGHIAALKCVVPGTREWLAGIGKPSPLDFATMGRQ